MVYIFSVDQLVKAVSGCIYEIAPNHAPRKMDVIMSKLVSKLRSHTDTETLFEGYNTFYFIHSDFQGIEQLLREVLWDIPEFLELNLTQNEYEDGVKVDDEDRNDGIVFVTRCGSGMLDWRNDFIDLDAVIQNAIYSLKLEVKDSLTAVYSLEKKEES